MRSPVLFEYRLPGLAGLLFRRVRCFEIRDDQVSSWSEGPQGIANRRTKALKDIPAKRRFREVLEPDFRLQSLTAFAALAALVVLLWVHSDVQMTWIVFTAGTIILSAMIPASILLKYPATYIPLGDNTLIIHHGKWHDAILAEIATRKQAHFAPMAVIDPDRSIRDNIKNLRWLIDIDAIPAETYWSVCQHLAPGLPHQARAQQTPMQLQQRRYLTSTTFDMKDDHVLYESRTFGNGGSRFSVNYTEVPQRSAIKETRGGSPVLFAATFLSGLFLALGADFVWIAPFNGTIESVICMGWMLMPVLMTAHILSFPVQEFRQGFFVLQEADIRGDEIISELDKRRTVALRALAAPDPVLTIAEQTARLKRFKENGIITDAEFTRLAAEAAGLNQSDLDRMPDAEPQRPTVLH